MQHLKNYIYIDMIGIDSLLAQITPEIIESSHIQTTRRKTGSASSSLGFSEMISKLFKGDLTVFGKIETEQIMNETTIKPYETKLQQIINYVEKNEVILKDKKSIIMHYKEDAQNFILSVMPFDTDFYDKDWFKTVDLANKFGYIPFYNGGNKISEYKDTYRYNDDYYKTMHLDDTKLTMNLSIYKMESLGGLTSHLGMLFRETKGLNIRLGVFGHIFKLTDSIYQIKPYAVWRV